MNSTNKSPEYRFDQNKIQKDLELFFKKDKAKITSFGARVNQTFEAFVFAQTIKWYKSQGWHVTIINPISKKGKNIFRLKFSTYGEPKNYSYALCQNPTSICQIRHQIRVTTKSQKKKPQKYANICCDVAVIDNINLDHYKTYNAVPNNNLLSFGEAKHMSGYAELIANFIGLVHELLPNKLKRIRINNKNNIHIPPFLYVSGILYSTAEGLSETISNRKFDVDIYSFNNPMR